MQRRVIRALERLHITVVHHACVGMTAGEVLLASGATLPCDAAILAIVKSNDLIGDLIVKRQLNRWTVGPPPVKRLTRWARARKVYRCWIQTYPREF